MGPRACLDTGVKTEIPTYIGNLTRVVQPMKKGFRYKMLFSVFTAVWISNII